MKMNDYQKHAKATDIYSANINYMHQDYSTRKILKLHYSLLGLSSEVGELHGKVKKFLRGDLNMQQLREEVEGELGDVLWYISDVCSNMNFKLEDIACKNLEKLHDRMNRKRIKGSGDNR